jgi:hypothetical protein
MRSIAMRSAWLILGMLGGAAAASAQCSAPCIAAVTNPFGVGQTTFTTPAIDTTGATFVAFSLSYLTTNQPVISDNKGNAAPTCLPSRAVSAGGSNRLCYLLSPAVGAGHTFTVTGIGNIYATIAAAAFSGVPAVTYSGITNGTVVAGPSSSFQPGSITPVSAGDLVITTISAEFAGATVLGIGSGFSITTQVTSHGGTNFGAALAYLFSPAGAAVNPAWTDSQSEGAGLTIASFSQSSRSIPPPPSVSVTSGGPAIL